MPINYLPAGTNLFDLDVQIIVNPVNCQGISGAGIAYHVSQLFPKETKVYERHCKLGNIKPGNGTFIPVHPTKDRPNLKMIFALPTIGTFAAFNKLNYQDKLNLVKIGLVDFRNQLNKHPSYKSVGCPALGCGVAGLKWSDVKPLIDEYLGDVSQGIYVIEPSNKE